MLNLVIIFFIGLELKKLIEYRKIEKILSESLKLTLNITNSENINNLNEKYENIISRMSKDNSLGELIKFIENQTQINQITIKDSKVLDVTDNEIKYQITLSGEMSDLANFLKNLETDQNPKEILDSAINIKNNLPELNVIIKSYRL